MPNQGSAKAQWDTLKQEYTTRKTKLDTDQSDANISRMVQEMKNYVNNFVNRGGISQSNNGIDQNYEDATYLQRTFLKGLRDYEELSAKITTDIKVLTDMNDLSDKYASIASLKNNIIELEQNIEGTKNDVEVSVSRHRSVKEPESEVSQYQGFGSKFGFVKPLHKVSVAILSGFGLFMILASGLVLREFFQPGSPDIYNTVTGAYQQNVASNEGTSFFGNTIFKSMMGGALFTAAVIVPLAQMGYLGKIVL